MRAVETTPTFLFNSLACGHEWEEIDRLTAKCFNSCVSIEADCLAGLCLVYMQHIEKGDMVVCFRFVLDP